MAVSIIETSGPETTETIHQRSDKSSQRSLIGEPGVNGVIIPRNIYLKLGNRIAMQRVTLPHFEKENNEFEFFMMEMQRYHETGIDVNGIAAIDEYLGSLGIDLEYPFEDDTYYVYYGEGSGRYDRNVSHKINGTVYNVIHSADGEYYNVTHDTSI